MEESEALKKENITLRTNFDENLDTLQCAFEAKCLSERDLYERNLARSFKEKENRL